MAEYPGSKFIPVGVEFPNNDPNEKPFVTNPKTQSDEVESGNSSVEWALASAVGGKTHEGLQITDVLFYTDSTKKTLYDKSQLFGAPIHFGAMNWVVPINANAKVSNEVTLYYDLKFKDSKYNGLDWDPTIKIKPRG